MRYKQWIFTITSPYSVRLKNLWMDKIALKSFTSNSRKLNRQKFHNYLACEFTAYSACRNTAINRKCATTNGLNFRIINSLRESCAWSGLAVKSARNGIMTVLELAGWIDHLRLSVDWEQVLQPSCATMPRKRPPNLGILRACLHDGGGPQVGEVSLRGQSPSPFSLPPYPLPPTPFDACYAG